MQPKVSLLAFELRHFRLAVAIVESGSLQAASRRLHLTPSALSHQLKDVEERLGRALFQRRHRKLVLTGTGTTFVECARRVLAEVDAATVRLSYAQEPTDMLRLSTGCYTCYGWLPAVLQRFSQRHAEVEVQIVLEATREPLQALLADQLDLALTTDLEPDARLGQTKLFGDELRLLVSSAHPLAAKKIAEPSDLASEVLITSDATRAELDVFTRYLWPAGVEPARTHRVPLTEAMFELVRAGLGVAAVADWMFPAHMEGLTSLRLGRAGIRRQWWAVYRDVDARRAPLKDFISHVKSAGLGTASASGSRRVQTAAR